MWGIAELPFCPARNGSISSPISVCWRFRTSVAKRSSEPPVIAIAGVGLALPAVIEVPSASKEGDAA